MFNALGRSASTVNMNYERSERLARRGGFRYFFGRGSKILDETDIYGSY